MSQPRPLAPRLEARRTERPESRSIYDRFVDGLRALGIGEAAPGPGAPFAAFHLPDPHGRFVALSTLLADGPIVLSFHRGYWCSFCFLEVDSWSERLAELAAAGARLVAITPEVGGRARAFADLLGPEATVLCDVDMGLALETGLAFRLSDEVLERYAAVGLDLGAVYGSTSGFLPVPATFVIDRQGVVRYAFVDADFRNRAEPSEVIAAVAAL